MNRWAVGPTGLEEPVELLTCGFCGWEDVAERMHQHKGVDYGVLGDPGRQDHDLCDFCYRSLAVSKWLNGLEYNPLSMEMSMHFNVLRASLEGRLT